MEVFALGLKGASGLESPVVAGESHVTLGTESIRVTTLLALLISKVSPSSTLAAKAVVVMLLITPAVGDESHRDC